MTRRGAVRAVRTVSLVAALALVAQSEWVLALAVGWPTYVAWLAPVALDSYVVAAVLARRDLGVSVIVSTVSVLASHALYAAPSVWVGEPGVGHLVWPLAASCSVVPLLVTWRLHAIGDPLADPSADTRADTSQGRSADTSPDTSGDTRSDPAGDPWTDTPADPSGDTPADTSAEPPGDPSTDTSADTSGPAGLTPIQGSSTPQERQRWAARTAARPPGWDGMAGRIQGRYGVSAPTAKRDVAAARKITRTGTAG